MFGFVGNLVSRVIFSAKIMSLLKVTAADKKSSKGNEISWDHIEKVNIIK